jgi:hypothetical protein
MRAGLIASGLIERLALIIGELLLAGLKRCVIGSAGHTRAHRTRPRTVAARVRELIAHRRELIEHRAPRIVVDGGMVEIGFREREELTRNRTARRAIRFGVARRGEQDHYDDTAHADVFVLRATGVNRGRG